MITLSQHKRPPRRRPAPAGPPAEAPEAVTAPTIAALRAGRRDLAAREVQRVQAQAGNRAVAVTLQRDQWIRGRPVQYTRQNRPSKGADVRAALRSELPGLLTGLSEQQLDRWQQVVDYYAVKRHIDLELAQLRADYDARYPGLKVEGQGMYAGLGQYHDQVRQITRDQPRHPPGDDRLVVDPQALLADDVTAPPEWDVKAEKDFRQWAVARLRADPPVFDMYPDHDDEIVSRRTALGTYTTKGIITLSDLRHRFAAEYQTRVVDRPEWRTLHQAYRETLEAYFDATRVHRERSDINKANKGWFGVDIVRNIIEAVGEGDQDYPSIRQWDEPKRLIDQAGPALRAGQFELAVPLLAMAELATAQAAQRIFAYDNRVETGAAVAVKWLNRVKTAGSVAAGIAAGPLGITGSALVAGGYTFVQEGAQNASALAHGQRTDLGLAGLVKQAGVATVLGLLGGALQTRFQAALSARLAQATGTAGGALREWGTSAGAAGLTQVYQTAAELALNAVVNGQAVPTSADQLADLVIDKVLEGAVMDVALKGPSARVAREYQAWRAGRSAPVITGPGAGPEVKPAGGQRKSTDLPDARTMPDDVARRLLREGGGWERLHTELRTGSGLGQGLTVPERQALISRFETTRELLARDVAAAFDGTVSITEGDGGRRLEVRFTGDGAAQHVAEARAYLDTKHPGWATETGVVLDAGPKATGAGPRSERLAAALEHVSPRARRLAARLTPLYERWTGLDAAQRLELLVGVVNEQLRAAGIPEVNAGFGSRGAAENGRFVPKHWELQINAALLKGHTQTPEQFAKACEIAIHEGHHAIQTFRAARTNPVMAEQHLDAVAFKAVMDANRPGAKAEPIKLSSLEWVEAAQVRESMWGSGKAYNEQVYARMDAADEALTKAGDLWRLYTNLPSGSAEKRLAAARFIEATRARDVAHDEYMNLPEEVEAWRLGLETKAAVAERLRLDASITQARARLAAAHDAASGLEDPFLQQMLDPQNPPTAAAQEALQRALKVERASRTALRILIERRARLALRG